MADAKHTPGPWRSRDGIITPADNDQIEIAEVFCENEGDYDEDGIAGVARADGLLIAAAPELLEALQAFFSAMHPELPGVPGSALEKARAAIAKATGSASHG